MPFERHAGTDAAGAHLHRQHEGIEGFTASLAFELETFGVRVKLVEPGYAPTTRFADNGGARMAGLLPEPYLPLAQQVFAALGASTTFTKESDVADAVWRAANDVSGQLRFPAGADAVALARQADLGAAVR